MDLTLAYNKELGVFEMIYLNFIVMECFLHAVRNGNSGTSREAIAQDKYFTEKSVEHDYKDLLFMLPKNSVSDILAKVAFNWDSEVCVTTFFADWGSTVSRIRWNKKLGWFPSR